MTMFIRAAFGSVHLRRKAHVTTRDLRSSLPWLLSQDSGRDDIDPLLKSGAEPEVLAELHYLEALAGGRERRRAVGIERRPRGRHHGQGLRHGGRIGA
jgi:hypothetical protein